MDTFSRIADLPVRIDGCRLERLFLDTSSGFPRVSVGITLTGDGHEGAGEDAWYGADDAEALLAAGRPPIDLRGRWTIASLSERLAAPDLFSDAPDPHAHAFRRWGFESAALDLGLRQAGTSLAEALGRPMSPVSFVVSLRLGEPSSTEPLRSRLAQDPTLRFKLDPTNDWDDALVEEIAAVAPGAVVILDFKGLYSGTPVDVVPDPALYRRCIEAFPEARIEDPAPAPEVREVIAPHMDRVSWDAPLRSLGDLLALERVPRVINMKPCRFGSLASLMQVYDHCEANGIGMYGGGFFELGAGRGQIQYLASLFHPDGPNDVAPRGFHPPSPPDGLPRSPLDPCDADRVGFRWRDADPPPSSPT